MQILLLFLLWYSEILSQMIQSFQLSFELHFQLQIELGGNLLDQNLDELEKELSKIQMKLVCILGATTILYKNVVVLTNYRRRQLFALSLTIKDKCGKTFFSAQAQIDTYTWNFVLTLEKCTIDPQKSVGSVQSF